MCSSDLIGFIVGLFLIDRIYHIRSQVAGFFLNAASLIVLLISYKFHFPVWVSITGLMLFELFLNAGPHLITFILPSQIFSEDERSTGDGLSASIGKSGAVISVFIFPFLFKLGGGELVLIVTISAQLLGGLITAYFGRKVIPYKDSEVYKLKLAEKSHKK